MEIENQEQAQQQDVATQETAEESSAFEAGFNQVRGEEPPAEPAQETPAEPAPEPEATPEPDDEPRIGEFKQSEFMALMDKVKTVDQLQETLAATERKLYGRIGELNSVVKQLQQSPKSGGVKLSAGQLKRLSTEFPDIAEMLTDDLNEVLAASGGNSLDQAQIDAMVNDRVNNAVTQANERMEQRVLTVMHPDWKQTVKTDEFGAWVNTLPPEEFQKLDESWDAEFIGEKLTQFKAWKAEMASSQQTRQTKQKRLESAITPQGASNVPASIDDNAAFEAGFNAVRGAKI